MELEGGLTAQHEDPNATGYRTKGNEAIRFILERFLLLKAIINAGTENLRRGTLLCQRHPGL